MKHIAVVGAGAVGGFLAARLHAAHYRVTLIARGAQLAAIQRNGLLVRDRHRTQRVVLRAEPALSERPDLILLAVKTQDLAEACAALLPLAEHVPVVTLQNGVQADHIAAAVLGRDAVLGAVAICAVSYLQAGEIEVHFPGWLVLGRPFARQSPALDPTAEILSAAVPTYRTAHLRRVRWSKLIANLNNGLCAATGLTLPAVGSSTLGRLLALRLMQEGSTVARAAGVHFDSGLYALSPGALRAAPSSALLAFLQASFTRTLPEAAALALLAAAGRSGAQQLPVRLSTWQSLARGRLSEIDYLNGEIARSGALLDLATPYNAYLVALVHRIEQGHPFVTLEETVPPALRQGVVTSVQQRGGLYVR